MNYKWLIISLLAFVVLFHVGVIVWIQGERYELTSPDYYQKELVYEQDIQAQRRAESYQWRVRYEGGSILLEAKNQAGDRLQMEPPVLELVRPNQADQDQQTMLTPQVDGGWSSPLTLSQGVWNYTVHTTFHAESLQVQGRLHVP